jgi:voltage-gated potassium channel
LQAGIKEAKGLVSTLGNDAENVFTVLTAREINKKLQIVARAIEPSAAQKLRKACADFQTSANGLSWRYIIDANHIPYSPVDVGRQPW